MANTFGTAFTATETMRLDQAIATAIAGVSRREVKRLLESSRVTLGGRSIGVASRVVAKGDRIAVLAPEVAIPLLDERDDFVVVDKPPGLPSQPSPTTSNPSVIDVVSSMMRRRHGKADAWVVHRLDTNTSGVMMVARTPEAARRLSHRISSGSSTKIYLAVVRGRLDGERVIDAPIGRVSGNVFGVVSHGKSARSVATPLSATDDATLLRVQITTGRTHQIRVHLEHIGHPVIGDQKYGSAETASLAARPMLHAAELALPEVGAWTAPLPADLRRCAESFGLRFP